MISCLNGGLTHRLITSLAAGVSVAAVSAFAFSAQAADDPLDAFELDLAQAVGPQAIPNTDFFLNRAPNTVIAGPNAVTNTAQVFYDNTLPQPGLQPVPQTLVGQAPAAFAAPVQFQQVPQQQLAPQAFSGVQGYPVPQQEPWQQQTGYPVPGPAPYPEPQPWPVQYPADPCPIAGKIYPAVQAAIGPVGATAYATRDGRGIFFEVPLALAYSQGGYGATSVAQSLANIMRAEQALYAQIIGHTDKKAGRTDAVDLSYSQQLADWMGQLISANGVNPQFIQGVGFGQRLPSAIGPHDRLEIRLVPAGNCSGFNRGGGSIHGGGHGGGYSYQQVGYGPGAGFAAPQADVQVQIQQPVPQPLQAQQVQVQQLQPQPIQSDILPSYGFGGGQPQTGYVPVAGGAPVAAPQVGFDPYQAAFSAPVGYQSAPIAYQSQFPAQAIQAQPVQYPAGAIPTLQPGQVSPGQALGAPLPYPYQGGLIAR